MSLSTSTDRPVVPRQRPRVAVAASVVGMLDPLIVALLMLVDRVRVQTPQTLTHVAFGVPFDWVTQDQGLRDSPLRSSASFHSPWESPTAIALLPLIVDSCVVGVVLLGVWRVVVALRHRRTTE